MSRYVEVPRDAIVGLLEGKGFVQEVSGNEVVYSFSHKKNPNVTVKVFTSLSVNSDTARGCGEDAIRVVTFYNNPKTGAKKFIGKQARVYRTGTVEGVLKRLIERAREAYQEGTDWLNAPKPWENQAK